jgi:hypothetical protein
MTGPLTLNADPTAGLGASTKQYVDKGFAGAGVIGCNATGTNTIALTPRTGAYAPLAYSDTAPLFTWVQPTTTTSGLVTINVNSLGAKNAYKTNGTPLGANDLIGGQIYEALYYSALNSGAGGFVVNLPATVPAGTCIGVNFYSTSQTITIPASATKGFVEMWGRSGGSGTANGNVSSGEASTGTGAAAFLRKILTGLTPGSTLIYTQGAAGAGGPANGGNGGASTLASGTFRQPVALVIS